MIQLFIAVVLLVIGVPISWADDIAVAKEFERFVQSATAHTVSANPVYLHSKFGKWVKQSYEVRDLRYDVKKTSSLLTPVVGEVEFTMMVRQTSFVDTEASAAALPPADQSARALRTKPKLTYVIENGKWVLRDAQQYEDMLRQWFEIGKATLWLRYWIP